MNPFRSTEINGRKLSRPLWRDTFVLTKRSSGSPVVEIESGDFTGRFVARRHVLSHEDLGMMNSAQVVR